MNSKLFALIALLLCSFALSMTSCLGSDDDEIDEEWKALNDKLYEEAAADPTFKSRQSLSGNGTLYWKDTDYFDLQDEKNKNSVLTPKITDSGTPYVTDSVVVRYEGWYFQKDGTKYVFDSTEGVDNNAKGIGFAIINFTQGGVMGWADMLVNMRVGDAVEVCIPYRLAYGTTGYYSSYGVQSIPGYTTLWFRIKLLKIIADNEGEFD